MPTDSQKLDPVSGSAELTKSQNGAGMNANSTSVTSDEKSSSTNKNSSKNTASDNINSANKNSNGAVDNRKNDHVDTETPTVLDDEVAFIMAKPVPDVEVRTPARENDKGKRRPAALLGSLKMNPRLTGGITCVVLGCVLVIFSLGILLNFGAVFKWVVSRRVVLSASSQGFPIWKMVSNHYDTKVAWHFFNLTNPDEFINGAMPKVQEVGPFWYKVNLTKQNIVFHNNKTVSFEEHRFFTFDSVNSISSEDTLITTINVPLMAAVHKAEAMGYIARATFTTALGAIEQAQRAVETYKVRELTYEGQPNTLVALAEAKDGIGSLFSQDEKKGRFGFGVDKNNTNPGIFNMYTGATGVQDLNRIHSDNGEHIRNIWPEPQCNVVDGTFGNLRPPMNETNSQAVYVPDMCRTITTHYQKDIEWHKLRLRRFNLTIDNFQSSAENPNNVCYDHAFHQPSGVAEVGPCKKGAPILMSLPHFMQADPKFREEVTTLNPDITKHEFIMDHEPTTGMTVRVRGRVQANVRVIPSDATDGTAELPTVIMPLFWQEMYVEGGPGVVAFLTKVNGYPGLGRILLTIVALFGLILAVIGAGLLITSMRNQRMSTIQDPKHKVAYSKAATNEPQADI